MASPVGPKTFPQPSLLTFITVTQGVKGPVQNSLTDQRRGQNSNSGCVAATEGLLLSWLLWRQNQSPALEPSGPHPSWGTRGNPRQPASKCSLSSWVTCLVFSKEIISMSSSQERGKTKLKYQSHRNSLRLISPDWPVAVVSHGQPRLK